MIAPPRGHNSTDLAGPGSRWIFSAGQALRLILFWCAMVLFSLAFFTGVVTWFRLWPLGGFAAAAVLVAAFVAMMADSVPDPDE